VARTQNGFVPDSRRKLYQRLKPLIREKCPFSNLPEPRSLRFGEGLTAEKMAECTWVKPEVVVQIDYTEWTEANHLRHFVFQMHQGRQTCSQCYERTWIKFQQKLPSSGQLRPGCLPIAQKFVLRHRGGSKALRVNPALWRAQIGFFRDLPVFSYFSD
jgi:hypothetical protein